MPGVTRPTLSVSRLAPEGKGKKQAVDVIDVIGAAFAKHVSTSKQLSGAPLARTPPSPPKTACGTYAGSMSASTTALAHAPSTVVMQLAPGTWHCLIGSHLDAMTVGSKLLRPSATPSVALGKYLSGIVPMPERSSMKSSGTRSRLVRWCGTDVWMSRSTRAVF